MNRTRKRQSATPSAPSSGLRWPKSKSLGGVTEIAVFAPIKKGLAPGERRTYEERLRGAIANLAKRHQQRLPTELSRVPSIHFGRLIVIRPEQYLVGSEVDDLLYWPQLTLARQFAPGLSVPKPIDDFADSLQTMKPPDKPRFRSWLLTLVAFDGDLRVYMRDIAEFVGKDFDLIFENCEEYPGVHPFEPFWLWVRRFQINTDLFYATYPELSVVRLKQLDLFKRRFDDFVARVRPSVGSRPASMDELFDEFLRENQQIAVDFPSPGGTFRPNPNDQGG